MNEQRQEPKLSHRILGAAMNPLQASHGEPHVFSMNEQKVKIDKALLTLFALHSSS